VWTVIDNHASSGYRISVEIDENPPRPHLASGQNTLGAGQSACFLESPKAVRALPPALIRSFGRGVVRPEAPSGLLFLNLHYTSTAPISRP